MIECPFHLTMILWEHPPATCHNLREVQKIVSELDGMSITRLFVKYFLESMLRIRHKKATSIESEGGLRWRLDHVAGLVITVCGSPAVIIYYKIASEPRRSGATAG